LVTRTLTLAPRLPVVPFTSFFSTAAGWGTVTLNEETVEIRLAEGELIVETLQVTWGDQTFTVQPGRTFHAGDAPAPVIFCAKPTTSQSQTCA
jgi:hypothetical protein